MKKSLILAALLAVGGVTQAASAPKSCSWNRPGTNPTTSSVEDTLKSMGIVDPELAKNIRAGNYARQITVYRNDERMHGMTSGQAHYCDGLVDTSRWADDQVEYGRVYTTSDGREVAWMWRCHNMVFWNEPNGAAVPPLLGALPPEAFAEPVVPPVLVAPLPSDGLSTPMAVPYAAVPEAIGGPYFYGGPPGPVVILGSAGGGSIVSPPGGVPPPIVPPPTGLPPDVPPVILPPPYCPPITAVPEPSTWALLGFGLAALAMRKCKAVK